MSSPGTETMYPRHGNNAVPYSFAIKFKTRVAPDEYHDFLTQTKTLCHQYPTSPTKIPLSGVTTEFTEIFQGFAGQFHPKVIEAISEDDRVEIIEDAFLDFSAYGPYVERNVNSWGTADVSRDLKALPNTKPPFKYRGSERGGEGVTIWILDGGCEYYNGELEKPRVQEIAYRAGSIADPVIAGTMPGSRTHGTNVAAIAAGASSGIAPKANVRALVVANGDTDAPTAVNAASAFEYIIANEKTPSRSVINCSWAGLHQNNNAQARLLLLTTLQKVLSKGFLVVAASGNGEKKIVNNATVTVPVKVLSATTSDSTQKSDVLFPASHPEVITVGAINNEHNQANFSNYGPAVDIWAPGVEIPSFIDGKNLQGTSFAAPLVAGVAACILSDKARDEPNLVMKPSDVKLQLLEWGIKFPGAPTFLHNGAT